MKKHPDDPQFMIDHPSNPDYSINMSALEVSNILDKGLRRLYRPATDKAPRWLIPGTTLWVREPFAFVTGNGIRIVYEADGTPVESTDPQRKIFNVKWASAARMSKPQHRVQIQVRATRCNSLHELDCSASQSYLALSFGLSIRSKDGVLSKWGITDIDGLPGTDNHGWPWDEWCKTPMEAVKKYWDLKYGTGAWDKNPLIWVIDFELVTP